MTNPICYANSSVSTSQLQSIQSEANERFTEARPIQDSEFLDSESLQMRSREIANATPLPHLGLRDYARLVTDYLNPPIGHDHRTFTNVLRLFHSNRITTAEINLLINFMVDPNRVSAFRGTAKVLFLNAKLFFYEYVPHQGAVQCFMPRN